MGDTELSSGADERYIFLQIEESMHKKELKCEARNPVSSQSASYVIELTCWFFLNFYLNTFKFDLTNHFTLNIFLMKDGPKFIEKLPSHKMVRLHEKLVLDCKVDSNPSALIFWSFNGQKIYAYSILTIEDMKPENYGTYKCTASLKDFPEVSSSVKIVRPGKLGLTWFI